MAACHVTDADGPCPAQPAYGTPPVCHKHRARFHNHGHYETLRAPVNPEFAVDPTLLQPVDDTVTDLAAGLAAEHLVCADLLLAGWRAFLADQNCPYDLAVEVAGRLVRIQVKATRTYTATPQRAVWMPSYRWHVKRAGKRGARRYGADEFDLLALVGLDIRAIAYLPVARAAQSIVISPPGAPNGRQFADYPFEKALADLT